MLIPDTMVSRRHATLSFRNGKYFLKDLGSSNGTLVNEARVAQDDEVEVGHGTVVQVENTNKITTATAFKFWQTISGWADASLLPLAPRH